MIGQAKFTYYYPLGKANFGKLNKTIENQGRKTNKST